MNVLCQVLLALFLLVICQTQAENFQQGFWREVFTADVVAPGASLSIAARSKLGCSGHCLQLEDCKTSAFHQHSATCWLYRHLVEYTATGVASPGTQYSWRLSASCPGELGYQLEAGMCFKAYTAVMNWTTAGETCRNDGGHLVIADTAEKWTAVLQKTNLWVWLGASDKDKEGEWRWLDGTLMQTTNWRLNEPNNSDGTEHFVKLYSDGLLNDLPEGGVGRATCEIPLLQ